jgi:hypothetical protein
MPTTRRSSGEFEQDPSRATAAGKSRPVFVTDRGRPTHGLPSTEHAPSLVAPVGSLIDLLAWPCAGTIRFVAPRSSAEADGSDVTSTMAERGAFRLAA